MKRTNSGKKCGSVWKLAALLILCLCITGCRRGQTARESGEEFGEPEDSSGESTGGREPGTDAAEETGALEPSSEATEAETEKPEETEPPVTFTDVSETVYAADRLNIRLEPSTRAEILRTMYLGEAVLRTGVSEEWSRILYDGKEYYAASAYLSAEPVIADTLSGRVEQLLPGMAAAKTTDQLVLAVGNNDGGEGCTVYYYVKNGQGDWQKRFETQGFWGFNGVKPVIVEADGCTPEGCFPFRFAFGIQSDPGSVMEYRQADPGDYVVDDVNSVYYNRWVNTSDEGVVPDWKSAEHIIDFVQSYNYALFIDNNPDCDPTQGSSAIFLHCTSPRGISPGCVNIPEEYMITLVTELKETSRIVLVYGVEDLAGY